MNTIKIGWFQFLKALLWLVAFIPNLITLLGYLCEMGVDHLENWWITLDDKITRIKHPEWFTKAEWTSTEDAERDNDGFEYTVIDTPRDIVPGDAH